MLRFISRSIGFSYGHKSAMGPAKDAKNMNAGGGVHLFNMPDRDDCGQRLSVALDKGFPSKSSYESYAVSLVLRGIPKG